MPFQFRLKVLQQHREYIQKRAQTSLATAQRDYESIESQIQHVKEQLQIQTCLWQEKQSEGIQVTDFLAFRDYIDSLEQQRLKLVGDLRRARKEVEKARKLLIEKEKEVKILESLEEQEKETYHHLESQKEQKQLDEVAIFRNYHRKHTS